MTEKKRTYIAIDLKSFYASVDVKSEIEILWRPILWLRIKAEQKKRSVLRYLQP